MYFIKNTQCKNVDLEEIIQTLILLHFKHDHEKICKILNLEHNPDYKKNNVPVYKFSAHGMIFLEDDNPITLQRIYVDKETKYILNTLQMVSLNIIDENRFTDVIINRWIKTVGKTGLLKYDKTLIKIVGKESYIQLKVGKQTWDDLLHVCKNKDILLKEGFKIAVLNFINYNITPTKPLFNNNDLEYVNQKKNYKYEKIEVLKEDKYIINDKININALTSYIENKVSRSYDSNILCDLNECWEWNKSTNHKYGSLRFNNNKGVAHRISYIIKNRYIPKDMIICHKCDNPSCINPNHLFVGTYSDNAKDAVSKGRYGNNGKCERLIFNEEQIKEIQNMFNNGIHKTEIAKKIGCNKQQLNIAFKYKLKE